MLETIAAFALDPTVLHLNHGSFGACPRAALDAQSALRARLEAAPARFLVREWQGLFDAARARVAAFVGADAEDLTFLPNPTAGVAAILGSRQWTPGDRVVVTDHGYRACKNTILRLVETQGIELVTVPVPVPYAGDIAGRIAAAACDPRCRVVLLDHVTSPTALVFDVATTAAVLAREAPEVELIVDAAHSPGHVELDLAALGAAGAHYAIAAMHKWTCAPKGSSILWARRDRRDALRPAITSHGETAGVGPANRFHARFDWSGTHDPTAYLATPAALDAVGGLVDGGWPAIRARNHALVLAARDLLADRLGSAPIAADAHHGAMAALPVTLPGGATALGLEEEFLDAGIEVKLADFGAGSYLRISAHVYNELADYDRLATALLARGVRGRR